MTLPRVLLTVPAAAALSLAGLSAAAAAPLPFPNCDAAAAVGVHNIPAGTPGYAPALDTDDDTVGCESDTVAYDATIVDAIVAGSAQLEGLPEGTGIIAGPEGTDVPAGSDVPATQVEQVPVGGADTGVAAATGAEHAGGLAPGAGAAVAAALAGGLLLLRRRAARRG